MGLPSHPVTGKSIMSMIPSERHLLRLFRVLDLDHSNILEADELRAIGKVHLPALLSHLVSVAVWCGRRCGTPSVRWWTRIRTML